MSAFSDKQRLRVVLGMNALVSGVTGSVVFITAPMVDRLLGTGTPIVVRVAAGCLVLFAAGVYLVSRADGGVLEKGVLDSTERLLTRRHQDGD